MTTDPLNDFAWYYVVNDPETEEQKSMGPVSLRDMDVLYRTQQINSNTYIFKQVIYYLKYIFIQLIIFINNF